MSPEEFDAVCRGLLGAGRDIQWGGEYVYKVGGRMFAVTRPGAGAFSLKVSEIAFEALTASGRAIPAPYLARAGWVRFADMGKEDGDEIAGLLAQAHALIAARLTRAKRRELGLE